MIARINIDNKERIAIILSQYDDVETITSCIKSIISLIQCLDNDMIYKEDIYIILSLLNNILDEDQQYKMFTSYFGVGEPNENLKPKVQMCKVTF